jgi:DNA-binding NarL/FixJ family response regulator
MAKKIKILIADDHAIFRHGLKDILAKHFPGATVGEAATGQAALEKMREADWDIVVLDVTMPGRNGVDVLREMKQIKPALPVLVLSMHSEEQYAIRVLKEGAAGYITKIKAPPELVEAVKRVLAGGKFISPALAEGLVAGSRPRREKPLHERLSCREFQVMCLLPSGKSLKAIAGELSVSIQTASTYRARILKKLGLGSTAELIRYTLENELVD